MATLIKERRIVSDSWRLLEPAPSGELPAIPEEGDVIVPLALWRERRGDLLAHPGRLGVWLDVDDAPELIASDIDYFTVIAVKFPKFGDGRGYSTARLLRERCGYRGELRAIGDVLHDHLYFMEQCGFDAFALRDNQDSAEALAVFTTFSDGYQTSVLRPTPLFRRRVAADRS